MSHNAHQIDSQIESAHREIAAIEKKIIELERRADSEARDVRLDFERKKGALEREADAIERHITDLKSDKQEALAQEQSDAHNKHH